MSFLDSMFKFHDPIYALNECSSFLDMLTNGVVKSS